jgi:hypothetical protein
MVNNAIYKKTLSSKMLVTYEIQVPYPFNLIVQYINKFSLKIQKINCHFLSNFFCVVFHGIHRAPAYASFLIVNLVFNYRGFIQISGSGSPLMRLKENCYRLIKRHCTSLNTYD